MKHIPGILIFCLMLTPQFSAFAGYPLRSIVKYDKTITTPFAFNSPDKFAGALHNDDLFIYLNQATNDSLRFVVVNLSNYSTEEQYAIIPAEVEHYDIEQVAGIAVGPDKLVMLSKYRELILFDRSADNKLTFNSIHELNESFTAVELNNSNTIVASKIYDAHPKSSPEKRLIQILEPQTLAAAFTARPRFHPIELTYFLPSQWVSVNDKLVAAANAATYEIALYDLELNYRQTLTREQPSWWKQIDTNQIVKLTEHIPPEKPRDKINAISKLYYAGSKLNFIQFLGDSLLAVRISHGEHDDGFQRYIWDFWKRQNGAWQLWKSDVEQDYVHQQPDVVIDSTFYPMQPAYNMQYMNAEYFVVLRFASGDSPLGQTFNDFSGKEDDFIATNPPLLAVDIFAWQWDVNNE